MHGYTLDFHLLISGFGAKFGKDKDNLIQVTFIDLYWAVISGTFSFVP